MFKAAPVAELLRSLIFSPLNHSSSHGCGFESRETSQVLLAGGQVFFLGDLSPTLWLTQLKILTGRKTPIK